MPYLTPPLLVRTNTVMKSVDERWRSPATPHPKMVLTDWTMCVEVVVANVATVGGSMESLDLIAATATTSSPLHRWRQRGPS